MSSADKNPRITGWLRRIGPIWAMGCALLMMPVASPVHAANLADINAALADMRALSGQFIQSTPGGGTCRAIFSRPARPLPIYLHARRTQCRDFARQLVGGAGVSGARKPIAIRCLPHHCACWWTGARRASDHRNWNPSPKKAARLKSPCATRRATFRGVWF